jgi:hypothetical protein
LIIKNGETERGSRKNRGQCRVWVSKSFRCGDSIQSPNRLVSRASREANLLSGANVLHNYITQRSAMLGILAPSPVNCIGSRDSMTEGRKYAALFAATMLAAQKLIDLDPDKPNMARAYHVEHTIGDAAFLLERIDKKWPTIENSV